MGKLAKEERAEKGNKQAAGTAPTPNKPATLLYSNIKEIIDREEGREGMMEEERMGGRKGT